MKPYAAIKSQSVNQTMLTGTRWSLQMLNVHATRLMWRIAAMKRNMSR